MTARLLPALRLLCLALPLLARPAAAEEATTVRIGHAALTSGWLARVGTENENAARLAVETLNRGEPRLGSQPLRFELIAVDDAAAAARSGGGARQLVAQHAVAVVGHMLSATSMAAAPVYAEAGIAQVTPTSTIGAFTRSGWPTAFRMLADDGRMALLLARHAVDTLQVQRVAIVDDGSVWGRSLAGEFERALRDVGARVLGTWHVDERDTDLGPLLRELQTHAPDAVFFGGFDRQAGPLLKQMRRLGLKARLVAGDGACTPDFVSYWAAGEAFDDQVLCALPAGVQGLDSPAMAAFSAAYQSRFGAAPEFYGAYAYDAVMVLADALQRAGSAAPGDVLRALAQTRGFPGLTGTIVFDARGDVVDAPVSLFTYRNEQRVRLRTLR